MGNYSSNHAESPSPQPSESENDETQSNGVRMDIRTNSPTHSNRTMIVTPPPQAIGRRLLVSPIPRPTPRPLSRSQSTVIHNQPRPMVRTNSVPTFLNPTSSPTDRLPRGPFRSPMNTTETLPPNPTYPAPTYSSNPSYPSAYYSYYPSATYPVNEPNPTSQKNMDPDKLKQYKQKTRQFQYSINCTQKQPYGYGMGSQGYGRRSMYTAPNNAYYPQPYPNYHTEPNPDENNTETDKGWTRPNIRVVKYYVSFLSYMSLVYHFYFFKLKKIEGYWSWAIIVFSSLSSALSLFQYHEEKPEIELMVKVTLTIFSLILTLISAWVKKQNYVERIAEIGKYSIKINKLKNTVKSILEEPIDTRILYKEFQLEHKKNIIEYISNRPLISPYEWKETVYIISKYYPELAAYEFPWNKVDGYGGHFMETFKKLKYNTCWKRIKNCYYCKSKCICKQGDADRQESLDILDRDIKFYRSLPKYDLDYNPYRPKDEVTDEKGTVKRRYSYSDSDISEKYEWEDEVPYI